MPITALPQETVRSIGSTQILTGSCSVVKELIDNSLDACALAIFVEVSVNSLDVIQVKDNGPGIHPNDRAMLGKRHCTSKIKSFADLNNIGGKSLGFRGEALASAAAICGSMIVSTRVDSEPMGVSLTINRQGWIEKEKRISQPVGTIVRLIDFLKNIPVRREAAMKASAKSLKNIKRLLQSYAFARPSVRFSLKILKAKNVQGNWAYVPTRQPAASDVAVNIVGKRVVDQCQWKFWNSCWDESPSDPELETDEASYKFEAILPTPSCDPSIVSNAGQYLSIDSRPVSGNRGSLKHIFSIYKSYLRSGSSVETFHDYKDPFLYLHIICPSGSYDVNVEPAKDDVLFADADFVIAKLERFLSSVYGELQTPKAASRSKANSKPGDFDTLLARKPRPTESPLWTADCQGRKIPSKFYNLDEHVEDEHDHHAINGNTILRTQDSDEEKALRDVKISNPWTFAKINTSIRHSNTSKDVESRRLNNQLLTPARQTGDLADDKRQRLQKQQQSHVLKSGLPSPARTPADHSTLPRAQQSPAHNPFSFPPKASRKKNDKHAPTEENTPQRGDDAAGDFNSWVAINKPRNNFLIPSGVGLFDHDNVRKAETRRPQTRGRDFVSARTLSLDAPLNGISELQADRIRGLMPRQRLERALKNGSFSSERVLPNISCSSSDSDPIFDSSLIHSISSRNPDLIASKDDERRKQGTLESIQRLKSMTEPRMANALQEKSLTSSNTIPSPHKSGQTLQACYLLENTPTAGPPCPNSKAIFEQGDPRAYLLDSIQQHNYNNNETIKISSAHHRLSRNRRKTFLLPLEAVREEVTTRDLIVVIPTTKLDIHGLLAGLRSTTTSGDDGLFLDEYIASGEFVAGLPFSSSESNNNDKSSMQADHYESKIRALLAKVYGDEVCAEVERLKFSSDLRARLVVSSTC